VKAGWALLLAGCAAVAPGATPTEQVVELDATAMGTEVQIVIRADSHTRVKALQAAHDAVAQIVRIEALMTDWNESSELSAINRAAGEQPVKVAAELLGLLQRSKQMSEITSGAFDVTYAGAGQFWDFKARPPQVPAPEVISKAIAFIDYRALELDLDAGTAFLTKKGMRIGLGGIAKGYAVDCASELIRKAGFKNHAVKAGGDMKVSGLWDKKLWSVAIRDPRDRANVVAVLPVSNSAISTSGDYERFFELDGVRYAHIIDPRTGYPVQHMRSVTIVSKESWYSDAIAKGVFVLGVEKGLKLIEALPEVEAVVIDGNGDLFMSSGLGGVPAEPQPHSKNGKPK